MNFDLRDESSRRLLSPDDAAIYLGLGSRWSIYRLIATGQLPALKLAGKLRIDRGDLDALIEALKCRSSERPQAQARAVIGNVPARLGPLPQRRPRARPVTVTVPATVGSDGV